MKGFQNYECLCWFTTFILCSVAQGPVRTAATNMDEKENEQERVYLLAALFAIIILLLILIILFIRRCMQCRKGLNTGKVHYDNKTHMITQLDSSGSNDRVTIVLEEIDHSVPPLHDEPPELVVEYTNLKSYRVSVEQFVKDFEEKAEKDIFRDEFKDIPNGLLELHSFALKKENKSRNRYKKVYPYDYCRVILADDTGTGDYINACFVHGFDQDKAYIASQGPFTNDTLVDFWRMIWQNQCARIVMLTNLFEGDRMKCLQYWPDKEVVFGPYRIRLQNQDIYEQYTIRHLIVEKNNDKRSVTQFHYTAWPDCRVPDDIDTLLGFRNLVIHGISRTEGPIVVHCSAGIGRTGTFIALDYLLKEGAANDSIDVINCVGRLRQQRAFSIQTDMQYTFLHEALVKGLKNHRLTGVFHTVDEM